MRKKKNVSWYKDWYYFTYGGTSWSFLSCGRDIESFFYQSNAFAWSYPVICQYKNKSTSPHQGPGSSLGGGRAVWGVDDTSLYILDSVSVSLSPDSLQILIWRLLYYSSAGFRKGPSVSGVNTYPDQHHALLHSSHGAGPGWCSLIAWGTKTSSPNFKRLASVDIFSVFLVTPFTDVSSGLCLVGQNPTPSQQILACLWPAGVLGPLLRTYNLMISLTCSLKATLMIALWLLPKGSRCQPRRESPISAVET